MYGLHPGYEDFDKTSGVTAVTDDASVKVLDAPIAGYAAFITDIHIVNKHATVPTTISILDDSTVVFTGWAPISAAGLPPVPIDVHFEKPLRITANKQVNIKAGTTGAAYYWNVSGFVARVYG